MEHSEKTKACLAWLNENYNLTSLSVADIVDLTIEWNKKDAVDLTIEWNKNNEMKNATFQQERKKKEEEEAKSRIDFDEEIDENGRVWYKRVHLYQQREESRKLKPGDIIRYTGSQGDFIENGMMIINRFDYESDFAARSYVQVTIWTKEKDPNYKHEFVASGLAPGIYKFSFATEEEIKEFFDYIKKHEYDFYYLEYFIRDGEIVPDFIKKEKRYAKYIEEAS